MINFEVEHSNKTERFLHVDSNISLLLGTLQIVGDVPDIPFSFVYNGFKYENYREGYISSMKKFFEFSEIKAVRFIPQMVFCGEYRPLNEFLNDGSVLVFPILINPGLKDEVIENEVSHHVQ